MNIQTSSWLHFPPSKVKSTMKCIYRTLFLTFLLLLLLLSPLLLFLLLLLFTFKLVCINCKHLFTLICLSMIGTLKYTLKLPKSFIRVKRLKVHTQVTLYTTLSYIPKNMLYFPFTNTLNTNFKTQISKDFL